MVAMKREGFPDAAAMSVRPVPNPTAWEACRVTQAGATAFHRWEWLRIMARALDKHLLPLGFYQAGALVGLAPLLVRHYGPLKSASWAPLPYLGPLVPGALLPEALRALDGYQRRNGIGLLRLGFAPDADVDPVTLERAGFDLCGDTTMVLPLAGRTEEQLLAALKYQRRQNIRRARDAGVVVAPATEREMAEELPAIMRDVFASRDQPPPYPAAAPALVWAHYHDDPTVHMTVARYDGRTAAALVTVIDRDRAYMWMGGSLACYRNVNPNALLYWDAICWTRAQGCASLDMVATPDAGIARFKAGFGCVEKPYIHAARDTSQAVTWARQARGTVLSLRQRLTARTAPSNAAGPRPQSDTA